MTFLTHYIFLLSTLICLVQTIESVDDHFAATETTDRLPQPNLALFFFAGY